MARATEIAVIYGGGLAQGLALVSVPAAATILTAADGYGLSSNQYGSIFLPLFVGSVLASLLAPTLARRRGLKTVLLAGFGCNALAMATFALSAALAGVNGIAFAMVLAATGLLGLGFGGTLTAINAYAAGFFPARSETAITALHTLLGTGTALAPLIVSLLAEGGAWWILPASIAAAAVLLSGLALSQPLALSSSAGGAAPALAAAAVAGLYRCAFGSGSPSRYFMASVKPCSAIGERSISTSSAPSRSDRQSGARGVLGGGDRRPPARRRGFRANFRTGDLSRPAGADRRRSGVRRRSVGRDVRGSSVRACRPRLLRLPAAKHRHRQQ
ncbi:MAG: hypothetical protein IPK66_09530 [Rhodospirillales bacterium]|nr:hypothetical protein [Rhodospirillales bacterium]